MTILQLVESVLPLSAEDLRCGMKKAKKLKRRAALIYLLNDFKNGKDVDFSSIEIMVDFPTFERKLQEWISGLSSS